MVMERRAEGDCCASPKEAVSSTGSKKTTNAIRPANLIPNAPWKPEKSNGKEVHQKSSMSLPSDTGRGPIYPQKWERIVALRSTKVRSAKLKKILPHMHFSLACRDSSCILQLRTRSTAARE